MNNPPNSAIDAKHLISRRISRPYDYMRGGMSHLLRLFTVISGAGETPVVQIHHDGEAKQFSFEEIVSTVVWVIVKEDREPAAAAAGLGFTAGNDVVVLEDFLNDSQRQAVVNAANSAGIDAAALRILNNPVCAALAYNLDTEALENGETQLNVLVYNHGGDDLSVSLFSIEEGGVFRMRAAARDTNFAGEEFTNRLLNHFVEKFNRKHNKDLTTAAASLRRLREACERAKRVLSSETRTSIEIDSLYEGIDFYGSISRDVFVILTIDLLVRSMNAAVECLAYACALSVADCAHVAVLVGGTSKIPMVHRLLQGLRLGPKDIRKSIDPIEVIGHGAHVYRDDVQFEFERVARMWFLDFTRENIGIATGVGDSVAVLIPKNTSVPLRREWVLTTRSDNQPSLQIRLFLGGTVPMDRNNSTDVMQLTRRIPPAPHGTPLYNLRIEIVDFTLTVWFMDNVFEMTNLWRAPWGGDDVAVGGHADDVAAVGDGADVAVDGGADVAAALEALEIEESD